MPKHHQLREILQIFLQILQSRTPKSCFTLHFTNKGPQTMYFKQFYTQIIARKRLLSRKNTQFSIKIHHIFANICRVKIKIFKISEKRIYAETNICRDMTVSCLESTFTRKIIFQITSGMLWRASTRFILP